mgnify:CR=1 FL=1
MKRVLDHVYATGTAGELRDPDSNLRFFKDPSKIVRTLFGEHASGLIVPRFMGVYQRDKIVPDSDDPEEVRDAKEEQELLVSTREENLQNANILFSRTIGTLDLLNPDLIFLAYNPQIWAPSTARESLDDKVRRIAIGSVTQLPDFPFKDSSLISQIYDVAEKMKSLSERSVATEEYMESLVQELGKQLDMYGATREEYAHLIHFKSAKSQMRTEFCLMPEEVPDRLRAR